MSGRVTIVGAGCGKGLITLRGLKAIQSADVILYDNLIDNDLLSEAREDAELVYVGKRYGKHSMKQEEISALIVKYARERNEVVRLKGGDSFVFGRGGEEAIALQNAGIDFDMVPGVSSSIAVPEEFGIPVTHRETSRSFCVVTAHTADGTSEDYGALAKLKGTLVFLMSLHKIEEITSELIKRGKSPKTPASVLSRGYSVDEKRYDGTLENIAEAAAEAAAPAILVVGETAGMKLTTNEARPLEGKHVKIVGTVHFCRKMAERLKSTGALLETEECLRVQAVPKNIPESFEGWKWLVFTSANGVDTFFRHLQEREIDIRSLFGLKFAVIGPGTAQALKRYGFNADFIPTEYTGAALGREAAKKGMDDLLILRSKQSTQELPEVLKANSINFRDIPIYESVGSFGAEDAEEAADYIIFGSAAGVRAWFVNKREVKDDVKYIAIGPVAGAELDQHIGGKCLIPREYTVDGIAELLLK
ncbi:MAG: uroporphyrinogen-III C-methyltransferase [Lachnospiraceae bacterium]|nr:uroporphyrinogen-III C-methyltransferase [Lachnospiraceae bacterium]